MTLILLRSEINISTESDGEIAYTPNEEKFDSVVNDIIFELDGIALERWDGDITDFCEAGSDE